MANTTDNFSIVKYQSIDEIVQSLADFSVRAKQHNALETIKPKQKLLGKSKTPTIDDINGLVNDVDGQLIELKNFNIEILDQIRNVCVLLSAVDKKHVDELLATATAAHEASMKATKNVESINTIMLILTSLQHLGDIDQIWLENEGHKGTLKALTEYKDELAKLNHINDVDKIWDDNRSNATAIENLGKNVAKLSKTVDEQGASLKNISNGLQTLVEQQNAFVVSMNAAFAEHQTKIDQQLEAREKALQETLDSLNEQIKSSEDALNKKVDELSQKQDITLTAMEQAQSDKLLQLEKGQSEYFEKAQKAQEDSLKEIKETQTTALKEIEETQFEKLDQIHKDQTERFDEIKCTVDEEKTALAETVSKLTSKVKTAYIVAGGACAITIIHLLLNVLGVI